MLQFYLYDTGTGRVLARGAYDESGDGAGARAIVAGSINALTEYAPAGVKTPRPVFAPVPVLDKLAILADAIDAATISNIPAGTVVSIFKDQDALPRSVAKVNDGLLVVKVDTAGTYNVVLSNFPTQDMTFQVRAT